MSRNFEVQIEVFPCATEQCIAVAAVLRQWGMTIEGECEDFDDNYDDGWSFWGEIALSAESEQDRHDQLVTLLPELAVITRWRWVDDELPWDVECISEPSISAA
jgi:hypothetical protein